MSLSNHSQSSPSCQGQRGIHTWRETVATTGDKPLNSDCCSLTWIKRGLDWWRLVHGPIMMPPNTQTDTRWPSCVVHHTITGEKPAAETLNSSSPAAAGAWLAAEGILGRLAESWAGIVVETSSSEASSSASEGSTFTFRPVALMETSLGTADTTAGATSDQPETAWSGWAEKSSLALDFSSSHTHVRVWVCVGNNSLNSCDSTDAELINGLFLLTCWTSCLTCKSLIGGGAGGLGGVSRHIAGLVWDHRLDHHLGLEGASVDVGVGHR